MSDRAARLERFLDAHGWGGAERRLLAGDASFRRYDRLTDGPRRAVLMDAPPPMEDVRPFVRVARHLADLGLSAPRVLAEDADNGFLLLEDLGDRTFARELTAGGDEAALYASAVDVLVDLHRRPAAEAVPAGLPPYDEGRLWEEASLLVDWFVPAVTNAPLTMPLREAYRAAWDEPFARLAAAAPTLVLRDYHVDNLMWLPERDGIAACGLLDFQDALAGPAAYDLMSLLEDARRDIDPDLKAAMTARYLDALPDTNRAAFAEAFAILAAQRHAKVVGIFTRLSHRDGKPDYLVHIPRVWRLLEAALEHPALGAVRAWIDTHLPPPTRRVPPAAPTVESRGTA